MYAGGGSGRFGKRKHNPAVSSNEQWAVELCSVCLVGAGPWNERDYKGWMQDAHPVLLYVRLRSYPALIAGGSAHSYRCLMLMLLFEPAALRCAHDCFSACFLAAPHM